jgi:hypothetical protein
MAWMRLTSALRWFVALLVCFAGAGVLDESPANAEDAPIAAQGDPSDAKKVPIYLADFELFSSATSHAAPKPPNRSTTKPTDDLIYGEAEPAPVQARRLMDFFAVTLVEMFHKNGYSATRSSGTLPPSGVLLRGVFAEPDDKNRIRRAILGAGSPNPALMLYVGTFNLSHQDQPLYQVAQVQSPDSHYGPVITLNAYVPMAKYDVDKDPTEEDVRKICGQVVNQLTKLLVENPNAIAK